MNAIEMTQVVKIEFVTGSPNNSPSWYGLGLTAPSAAQSKVDVAVKPRVILRILFTKNLFEANFAVYEKRLRCLKPLHQSTL
jgi:hypothetical protein